MLKKVIYKYTLNSACTQTIEMPIGAEIINVAYQGGDIRIWCIVSPEFEKELRKFEVFGTGQEFQYSPGNHIHLATLQSPLGSVWHVFESINP